MTPRKGKSKGKGYKSPRTVVKDTDSSYGMQSPVFLGLDQVLQLHTQQLERFGGSAGVRDRALLESALAQPESGFGGQWLHDDFFEMAAAYAFHICKNHPFFDGNKRTALDAALVFLEINGIDFRNPREVFVPIMLAVAEGKMGKKELARVFRDLPRE